MKNKFKCAFQGIWTGMHHTSILVQMVLACLAVIAGLLLQLTSTEWCLVVLCIGCVITTEMLNTCIEKICNMYSMEYRTDIRIIKDMAAGAVLISSLMSFVIAMIILIHHL